MGELCEGGGRGGGASHLSPSSAGRRGKRPAAGHVWHATRPTPSSCGLQGYGPLGAEQWQEADGRPSQRCDGLPGVGVLRTADACGCCALVGAPDDSGCAH